MFTIRQHNLLTMALAGRKASLELLRDATKNPDAKQAFGLQVLEYDTISEILLEALQGSAAATATGGPVGKEKSLPS